MVLSKLLGDPSAMIDGVPFPCGQCLACRINRRRVWTIRLILELESHDKASFTTLTYADEALPYSVDGYPTLCKRDLQLFNKRLRKSFGTGVRFFACGEYGPKTHRPHYHGIYFGVSPDELDEQWMLYDGRSGGTKGPESRQSTLSRLWSHGLVHVGEVTKESIQYVAGYVTKKLGKKEEYNGRQQEFTLCSRRPGIGGLSVDSLCDAIGEYARTAPETPTGKVVHYDGRSWPLGRYLLGKLSEAFDDETGWELYLSTVWQSYLSSRVSNDTSPTRWHDCISQTSAQYNKRLEARARIFERGGL